MLGKKHPDTLDRINNLALVLGSQGKHQEAEKIHRQTLASIKTVLGKEHSVTLMNMSLLAVRFPSS